MSSPTIDVGDAVIAEEDMFETVNASQLSIINSEVLENHILQFVDEVNDDNFTIPALSQDSATPDMKFSLSNSLDPAGKYPSSEDYCHEDVAFTVLPSSAQGSGFVYSSELQKLFLKTESTCSFDVKCELFGLLSKEGWYVRVMLLPLAPESQHDAIVRCHNHLAKDTAADHIKRHVVRCKNVRHEYMGSENGPFFEDRYAVRVPLDSGELSTSIMLQFMCQNTCFHLNQRRTGLVFTLENEQGHIWARRMVQVKICINFRRDMQNEEKAASNHSTHLSPVARSGGNRAAVRRYANRTIRHRRPVQQQGSSAGVIRTDSFQLPPTLEPCLVDIEMPNLRMAKRLMDIAIGMISSHVLRTNDSNTKAQLMQLIANIRDKRDMLVVSNSQCSVDSDLL
uniref:p53 DNA-binding domain-containing protein n=1 Tax=Anopheles culicifacies TaxID=139723 RepID=A0A182LTY8_9DIPT